MGRNTVTLHSALSPKEIADKLRNREADYRDKIVLGSITPVGDSYEMWFAHAYHNDQAIFEAKLEKLPSGTRIDGTFSRPLSDNERIYMGVLLAVGALLLLPVIIHSIMTGGFDSMWFWFISGMILWLMAWIRAFIRPIKAGDRRRYLAFLKKHLQTEIMSR